MYALKPHQNPEELQFCSLSAVPAKESIKVTNPAQFHFFKPELTHIL